MKYGTSTNPIMHRLAQATLLTAAALSLGAGPITSTALAAKGIQIVTTTEDLASLAREVGGDRVKVQSLSRGYQDPHFVDAKPSYMVSLKNADLFIEIGRDLEAGWAPGLLNGSRNPRILPGGPGFVDASAEVQVVEIPASVSRTQGDVHPFGNPHYWLDPANGVPIARTIRDALIRISPADAPLFNRRCADFEKRLDAAIARWREQAKSLGLTGMKIVTYHRSWSYFASAFGLDVVNFVEPRPGIPPSPNHVQNLVHQLESDKVRLIIMEAFFDPRLPQKISKDAGVPLVVLPTSVGAEDGIDSYIDLFDHLLAEIGKALKS